MVGSNQVFKHGALHPESQSPAPSTRLLAGACLSVAIQVWGHLPTTAVSPGACLNLKACRDARSAPWAGAAPQEHWFKASSSLHWGGRRVGDSLTWVWPPAQHCRSPSVQASVGALVLWSKRCCCPARLDSPPPSG